MSTQHEDQVVQFLLSTLPPRLLAAYRTMAGLRYPIPDRPALTRQLDALVDADKSGDRSRRAALDVIRLRVEAVDFPIETPWSGLEKLHARLAVSPGSLETADRESVEQPDIADIYERTFGRECGAEAAEAYAEAILGGRSEAQAVIAGHLAGEDCQRRVAQALRDFIRRREPRRKLWPWF